MNPKIKRNVFTIVMMFMFISCTSSPTKTAVPDPTATAKPSFTPTPAFTNTPSSTSIPETETIILEESASSNGNWSAIISLTNQDRNKKLEFRASNKSSKQEWLVEQTKWNELETPSSWVPFPYIFKWSNDNNYLYYSHEPNFNDGCFGIFRPGGLDLNRIDLNTGEIVTILDDGGTWMALSPDEKKLAYIDTFGGNVSIVEIESTDIQTFPLPPIENEMKYVTDTSDLYWSPDGNSLVYAHYVGACDLLVPFSYIIQLYPDTNQQKFLIENDEHGYVPLAWNIQDQIVLKGNENRYWWLNPITKDITPVP